MREIVVPVDVSVDAYVPRAHEPTVAQYLSGPVQEERATAVAERTSVTIEVWPGW
jgi:hypothetical protein